MGNENFSKKFHVPRTSLGTSYWSCSILTMALWGGQANPRIDEETEGHGKVNMLVNVRGDLNPGLAASPFSNAGWSPNLLNLLPGCSEAVGLVGWEHCVCVMIVRAGVAPGPGLFRLGSSCQTSLWEQQAGRQASLWPIMLVTADWGFSGRAQAPCPGSPRVDHALLCDSPCEPSHLCF